MIGDLDANLRMIDEAVRDAMGAGVQLLVLPELVTSGYHLTPEEARATGLASRRPGLRPLGVGAARRRRPRPGLLRAGRRRGLQQRRRPHAATALLGIYRKTHLWDTEKDTFTPGSAPAVVLDTPVGPLGTLICYDLEFPEMPRGLALAGAEIIAVPTNWPLLPTPPGEHPAEVVQAMAAARASQVAIACCDRTGAERGTRVDRGHGRGAAGRLAGGGEGRRTPAGRRRRAAGVPDGHQHPQRRVRGPPAGALPSPAATTYLTPPPGHDDLSASSSSTLGPVIVLLDHRDDHHERCRDFLETSLGPLLLPAMASTEVCL